MAKMNQLPGLVASDIDGTLCQGGKTIPPFTTSVLNQLAENNILVVLITGYNYRSTMKLTRGLNRKILLISQNGTFCIRGRKPIWEYLIPKHEAKKFYDYLDEHGLPIIAYKGKGGNFENVYISQNEISSLAYAFQRIRRLDNFEDITGISTLVPYEMTQTVRSSIESIVGDKFKVIYSKSAKGSWLEIVHMDVRKDLALKRLCEELSIPLSQVLYFGDNYNDLEVLRMVGYPVVVENAVQVLKDEFKTVIKPVTKEGAAVYLNDLFRLAKR